MSSFNNAVVSMPGAQREARTPFGTPVILHATGAETGGAFGIWETITPPGAGPAAHMHTREAEIFRVLEGTYRLWCGDTPPIDAPAGTVVVLPANVPHHWRNIGKTTGRMMGVVTPGGFEQMFLELAALGSSDPGEVAKVEIRYGIVNDETRKLAAD